MRITRQCVLEPIGLAALLLLSISCDHALEVDHHASRVIGGDAADGSYQATGALIDSDFGEYFCTGTLISPSVILTAAHCLVTPPGEPDFVPDFTLEIDANKATEIVKGLASFVHPDFDIQKDVEFGGFNDIALATLAEPIADAEFELLLSKGEAEAGLAAGAELGLVGYGVTSFEPPADGVKTQGTATVIEVGVDEFRLAKAGEQQNCFGDSGGPGFLDANGQRRLAGIVSRGASEHCDAGSIDTRVDPYVGWIMETVPLLCEELDCSTGVPRPKSLDDTPQEEPSSDANAAGCSVSGGHGTGGALLLVFVGLLLGLLKARRMRGVRPASTFAGLVATTTLMGGCGSVTGPSSIDVDGGADAPYQPALRLELKGNLEMDLAADVAAFPGKDIVFVSNWRKATVSVVDVSNPSEPTLLTTIDAPESTDVQVKGNFLYVNGDDLIQETTAHGIRIYDIEDPADPKLLRLVGSEAGDVGLKACHNLWLQPDRDLVYCASTFSGEVVILSEGEGGIGAAAAPEVIATIGPPSFAASGVHDMFARGNRLYVAWLEGGFAIYDISDAAAPIKLGGALTDEKFTHTVWPSEDGDHVFATDETINGHLTIWDVSDPTSIDKVADYQPNSDAVIHNAEVVGDIVYISYYTEGVKVVDISNPGKPNEIDGYDMFEGPDFNEAEEDPDFPGISRFKGAWGVDADFPRVYVSTIESGLWVFELTAIEAD